MVDVEYVLASDPYWRGVVVAYAFGFISAVVLQVVYWMLTGKGGEGGDKLQG